jgi:hypothetical protein
MPHDQSDDFLKRNPHLKEFVRFLDLLNKESERGAVLIAAGFLEQQLRDILAAFMLETPAAKLLLDGANAPIGTFSSRIAACHSLGLISDDEHHDLNQIRQIRNAFAHDIHTSFETQRVVDRCAILHFKARDYTSEGGEVKLSPAGQFSTAATGLILSLVNRPHYVGKQRRTYGNWLL